MTAADFDKVCVLAFSGVSLIDVNMEVLFGCAMPEFKPVVATDLACARMVRWQTVYMDGSIDSVELNELHKIFRQKVQVIHTERTSISCRS